MFQIEKKKVPLPRQDRQAILQQIPWADMKSGDSVLIPASALKGFNIKSIRADLYEVAGDKKIKISTTIVDGGIRVWRN